MSSIKCDDVLTRVVCTAQCTQLSSQNVSLPDYLSLLDVTVQTQKVTNTFFLYVICNLKGN